jgi:hypothetical protein
MSENKTKLLIEFLNDAGYGEGEGINNIAMDAKWRPNGTDIIYDTLVSITSHQEPSSEGITDLDKIEAEVRDHIADANKKVEGLANFIAYRLNPGGSIKAHEKIARDFQSIIDDYPTDHIADKVEPTELLAEKIDNLYMNWMFGKNKEGYDVRIPEIQSLLSSRPSLDVDGLAKKLAHIEIEGCHNPRVQRRLRADKSTLVKDYKSLITKYAKSCKCEENQKAMDIVFSTAADIQKVNKELQAEHLVEIEALKTAHTLSQGKLQAENDELKKQRNKLNNLVTAAVVHFDTYSNMPKGWEEWLSRAVYAVKDNLWGYRPNGNINPNERKKMTDENVDKTEEDTKKTELQFFNYRKKPIVIQAAVIKETMEIETLEGTMTGNPGDMLIIGVEGEKYPCKPDIFEKTYEAVPDESATADTASEPPEADKNDGGGGSCQS